MNPNAVPFKPEAVSEAEAKETSERVANKVLEGEGRKRRHRKTGKARTRKAGRKSRKTRRR
jgi:hypothetical protein